MRSGGAEKSLLSLLTLFDYEKYDVDLLCFRHDGLFFEKIPENVNVLGGSESYEMFDGDAVKAVKYFLKKGRIFSAVNRVKYSKISGITDIHQIEEMQWKYLKKQLPKIKKNYDCAIGYLEGNANRFAAEKVNAKQKICYIHTDVDKIEFDKESYEKVFSSVNIIVTVSEECKTSLLKFFPNFKDKIFVIENITSKKILLDESKKINAYKRKSGEKNICTVGRFSEPKNIELAVDACAELIHRGRNIKWYHIGDGELRSQIKQQISDNGIEDAFILLGEQENPYPYIGQCDIYVQPSRFEGKSIAIDEAKCLCRPIVVTDFPTVNDQIDDGKNGIICHMDKYDMADKIEALLDNEDLRKKLSENLSKEKVSNEDEISKLYELITD
jgi:glycosyltransferase involved in cell wall biosynthesis